MSKAHQSNDASKQEEQTFSILPHPAVCVLMVRMTSCHLCTYVTPQKTNNPADLNGPRSGDMPSVGERMSQLANSGPGPHILSNEQQSSLPAPLVRIIVTSYTVLKLFTQTREELRKRAAELNK